MHIWEAMRSFNFVRFLFQCKLRTLLILTAVWCVMFVGFMVWSSRKPNKREDVLFTDTSTNRSSTGSSGEKKPNHVPRNADNSSENAKEKIILASSATIAKESAGKLNLHMWSICGFHVNDLKQSPLFPRFPDRKGFVTNFATKGTESNIGQRVFGFVYPKFTGKYQFAITSDDTSELWLSANEDPGKVRLVASVHSTDEVAWTEPGNYKKYPSQISGELSMEMGKKYFIEALHKDGGGASHVSVLWKPPGAEQFDLVTGQFLSPFYADNDNKGPFLGNVGGESLGLSSHPKETPPSPVTQQILQFYHNTTAFRKQDLAGVLPSFLYSPSYVVNDGNVSENQGIYIALPHHSSVYPEDTVQIKPGRLSRIMFSRREFLPNEVLPKADAEQVVNQFMKALESKHKR